MGAGKSSHLLNLEYKLLKEGKKVLIAKPSIDTRDVGVIKSRIGLEKPCHLIKDKIYPIIRDNPPIPDFILVDECQFLNENQVYELADIVDRIQINVICYGLRTDYRFKLFDGSKALFELADELIELPYNDFDIDKKITHMKYVDDKPVFDGNPIEPGDEIYKSVSRKEWFRTKGLQDES